MTRLRETSGQSTESSGHNRGMAVPSAPEPAAELGRPAAEHWSFPRGAAGIVVLLDFAAEQGVPSAEVVRGLGVDEAALHDPSTLVPAEAELGMLRNLAAALGSRDGVGIELGARYHVTAFGVLGFALMSSRTVAEAMSLALRFLDLSHIFTVPQVDVLGEEVLLALDTVDLPPDLERLLVERDLAAIHTVLGQLVPGGVPFTSVDLAFPAPARDDVYVRVLGVRPRFGAPRTVVRFDAEHLGRALPQASPHSLALAEQMCRDVVSHRRDRDGVTEQVRVRITQALARPATAGEPAGAGMPAVAAALSMSERTLRRRLAASGTRYQALLDEVRQALAEELLETGMLPVEDVAQRLGYAESSSFIHAFKRWRGETPVQYRDRVRRRPTAAPGSVR